MGVILPEDLADHAGGFLIGPVPREAELLHREEHAAVDGLETVTDVRQRASDDDGHRVVQIGLPHLLFDRNRHLPLVRHKSPSSC